MNKQAICDATTIDVHAHAVLEQTLHQAGSYGPEIGQSDDGQPWFRIGEYYLNGVRYRGSAFMDPQVRMSAMDRANIDYQLLSPNPLTYFHHIPVREAVHFCQLHNDALATLCSAHSGRLGGLAALPMQDPAEAVRELTRAVTELDLLGAGIGTDLHHMLGSEALDEFWAACVRLNVPVFLHPAPAGIDGPPADPRIKRYELDIMFGFSIQETIATVELILDGVLHRHPGLDICLSHGGGAIAFIAGRMSLATRRRRWCPDHLKADGAFEAELQKLWFDTHVHDHRSLALLADVVGTQRLVLGTNFAGWDQPEDATLEHVPGADLGANAKRLLRAI